MNIREETSRTEIRTNTVRQGCQRLGQRWKEGQMRSREKGKETEKKVHHLHVQLALNWHVCAQQCIAFNCTTAHHSLRLSYALDTLTITPHFKEGAGFVPVHVHDFCVMCLCISWVGVLFLHVRVLVCRGVWQICAFFQIESLYVAPVFCLKGNSHLQADRSLFRERFQ